MNDYPVLRFGVPSIDELLGLPDKMSQVPGLVTNASAFTSRTSKAPGFGTDASTFTSMCLVGPDGTGKSVLAMHLASVYAAQHTSVNPNRPLPLVIYVSTDLSVEKANSVFKNFGLNEPHRRFDELYKPTQSGFNPNSGRINLSPCSPLPISSPQYPTLSAKISEYIINPSSFIQPSEREILLLDLESTTAGDDWGLITDLLAVIPAPDDKEPLHLLIIDAIEGLQMTSGNRDAYGEERTRRSRIEPIIRAAHSKAHVVLVLEEPTKDIRFDEQFVTDAVVRLRTTSNLGYSTRTVEIEKARGQSPVRGQHSFTIRDGKGTTTGLQENVDNIRYRLPNSDGKFFMSHILAFHSLDYLDSKIRASRSPLHLNQGVTLQRKFGIKYLDEMLEMPSETSGSGLRGGTITSITGDVGTHKSHLTRAFLADCFSRWLNIVLDDPNRERTITRKGNSGWGGLISAVSDYEKWKKLIEDEKGFPDYEHDLSSNKYEQVHDHYKAKLEKATAIINRVMGAYVANKYQTTNENPFDFTAGFAVLITTDDLTSDSMANKIWKWLRAQDPDIHIKDSDESLAKALIESRIICRRLEAHTVSPSLLIHIISEAVDHAIKRVKECHKNLSLKETFLASGAIHVVIDDWDVISRMYPAVANEPKFLEFLKRFLERKGVTTAITESRAGVLPQLYNDGSSNVSRISDRKLQTWHVSFHGRRIVAISPIPTLNDSQRSEVRQIRLRKDNECVFVDPYLELFKGLTISSPEPVQLKVRLFADTLTCAQYVGNLRHLFSELFPQSEGKDNPVIFEAQSSAPENTSLSYDQLREYCYLIQSDHLDHTVVVQIDEFWLIPPSERYQTFSNCLKYLTEHTTDREEENISIADPYRLFQPTEWSSKAIAKGRWDYFDTRDYAQRDPEDGRQPLDSVDRIPYVWDFQFLLCRNDAWTRASALVLEDRFDLGKATVDHVWKAVNRIGNNKTESETIASAPMEIKTWRTFFEACTIVARNERARSQKKHIPFDVSSMTAQSLACLVLAVWASEVDFSLTSEAESPKRFGRLSRHSRLKELKEEFKVNNQRRGLVTDHKSLVDWILGDCPRGNLSNLYKRACQLAPEATKDQPIYLPNELQDLTGFSLELYMTMQLIFEAVNVKELIQRSPDVSLQAHEPNPLAIAAIHWYKTASHCMTDFDPRDAQVPVKLPGNYSVRGDWFLAIAKGSRSRRLGERAVDLMSSRKSNIQRLQAGAGLPTRLLASSEEEEEELDRVYSQLTTTLYTVETPAARDAGPSRKDGEFAEHSRPVTYKELLSLGQPRDGSTNVDLKWLWRSNFRGYDRHALVFENWICRVFREWEQLKEQTSPEWKSGYDVYDQIRGFKGLEDAVIFGTKPHSGRDVRLLTTFRNFGEHCDGLVSELLEATPKRKS